MMMMIVAVCNDDNGDGDDVGDGDGGEDDGGGLVWARQGPHLT